MTNARPLSALLALALLASGSLAACSGDVVVDSPTQSESQSGTPNLDAERIDAMLREAQETIDEADKAGKAELLTERVSDPALKMRAAQYTLASKTGAAVPHLDLTPQLLTVTNSAEWPRVVVDISKAESGALPAAYVFVQEDARSGYKLQNWTRLLGGTKISTLSVQEGSPYLAPDAAGFVVTPKDAIAKYAEVLNSGTAGSDLFTADEFTQNSYLKTVKDLNEAVSSAGTVTAKAQTGDFPVTGVLLQDGSALVSGTVTYSHTYDRTIARSKMQLGGSPAALAGDANVVGKVTVNYLLNVLIRVPVEGSNDKASVIGVERAIESVTRDDAAKPEGE
ncbi:hypothetical protein [Schaalia sp. Marseille-Q2122]|uniref:hypothetical protein n=1 Tax=Schaalia sp. Marseille-Q2122 TaxID=2736604 RepID=UPI0015891489|nr:hypothetical protein [Schaalia sp. Marseille-Q2122]